MNLTELTSLLHYPNAISKKQTFEIEEILETYPYFQSARIIHLKGLKNQNSFKYNTALKLTAAYTTNRTILFDFITSESLDASHSLEIEKELIENSDVVGVELIEGAIDKISSDLGKTDLDKIQVAAEKLEIGKPLVFDLSEMHSFHQWLQLTSLKPIEREATIPSAIQKEKDGKFDLIEDFIKSKPKIQPLSSNDTTNIAVESTTENKNLMTETLARVYLEQKQYGKAIQAFKILSLKYPEKSSFFADRIKAIKFLQKNNT